MKNNFLKLCNWFTYIFRKIPLTLFFIVIILVLLSFLKYAGLNFCRPTPTSVFPIMLGCRFILSLFTIPLFIISIVLFLFGLPASFYLNKHDKVTNYFNGFIKSGFHFVSLCIVIVCSAYLLTSFWSPLYLKTTQHYSTALEAKMLEQDTKGIKELIEQGADPNQAFPKINYKNQKIRWPGQTPLMTAALSEDFETFEYIYSKGGDINHIDDYGNNILLYAFKNLIGENYASSDPITEEQEKIVLFILDKGFKSNEANISCAYPVEQPVKSGNIKLLKKFFNHGYDVNNITTSTTDFYINKDKYKCAVDTPLITAAKSGDIETIKFLLSQGATISQPNSDGNITPVLAAINERKYDAAKFLIPLEKDLSFTNGAGNSYLGLSVWYTPIEILEFLIEHGADLNHKNLNNETPLVLAASAGNFETFKFLKSKGAILDKEHSSKALWGAISKKNVALAKELLEMGVNPNGKMPDYSTGPEVTLADYAYTSSPEIYQLMLEYGAEEAKHPRTF